MMGHHQNGAYDAYPFIRQKIGENPARYLAPETDLDPTLRIRGIHDEAVLDAWQEVEEDIGPRREVMKHLNRQRQYLREARSGETFADYWDRTHGLPDAPGSRVTAADGGDDA